MDFNGKFIGNGYSICFLTWDEGDNYQGLFARIGEKGEVRGVKILGAIRFQRARLVGGIAATAIDR